MRPEAQSVGEGRNGIRFYVRRGYGQGARLRMAVPSALSGR